MYIHVTARRNGASEFSYLLSGMNGLSRGESAGGAVRCVFQRHGLGRSQALFESVLSGLPAGFQFPQQRFPLGAERPVALSAVSTDRIACKASLLYERQRPRGRRLVNAKSLRQLRCGQASGRVEKLQRRELRGMEAAAGEHIFVEHGYSPGGLPKRGAVTRERHQFHGA
jgi:hypothetical protein